MFLQLMYASFFGGCEEESREEGDVDVDVDVDYRRGGSSYM